MMTVVILIFTKKKLFYSFLKLLPEYTIKTFQDIAWRGSLPKNKLAIPPELKWLFLKSRGNSVSLYTLPYFIRKNLKSILNPPESFEIKGQDTLENTAYQFLFENSTLSTPVGRSGSPENQKATSSRN